MKASSSGEKKITHKEVCAPLKVHKIKKKKRVCCAK